MIILGRYPEWLYNFNSGVIRFAVRIYAWVYLQTDEWPPFGLADDPSYPIRVNIPPPPAERQSRLKALFRLILALPMLIVSYARQLHAPLARGDRLADDRLPRLPAGGRQQRAHLRQQLLRPPLRLHRVPHRRLPADRARGGEALRRRRPPRRLRPPPPAAPAV